MSAILQIVDGHAGALVLELNGLVGGRAGWLQRGVNLTEGQVAGLSDAVQWSPLAGPSALGRRRITVPFVLVGLSADDVGARVTKLMQATAGPWWLRVRRHGASADSWLQCFGCVPQVDSQITASGTAHLARGTITCETAPYALGARVDGSAAVGQDPSGPAWALDVNSVAGDAATPLLLRLHDPAVFGDVGAVGAYVTVRRRQTPANLAAGTLVTQAEDTGNTLAAGTGIAFTQLTGDAAFSGGKGVRATFSGGYSGGDAAAITFDKPALTGLDVPGTYRVFVRVRRDFTAVTQQLVLKAFTNGSLLTPEDITVPAGGSGTRLVDLGLVQWPAAAPATLASPVPTPSGSTPTRVTLQFWRKSSGAAKVDFDYMCWLPADEDAGYLDVDGPLPFPDTQWVVVDGYQQQAMVTSGDPRSAHTVVGVSYASSVPLTDWTGGVPRVSPGSNRLFVTCGLSPVTTYPPALNLQIAYSYWPRYTWLR